MRSLQGSLIIAGVFQAVIGFFGIWRVFIRSLLLRRLLSPRHSLRPCRLCVLACSCTDTVAVVAVRARFLSPLAAAPFVTLSGLGLFYFTFPGVSSELVGTAGRRVISSCFAIAAR